MGDFQKFMWPSQNIWALKSKRREGWNRYCKRVYHDVALFFFSSKLCLAVSNSDLVLHWWFHFATILVPYGHLGMTVAHHNLFSRTEKKRQIFNLFLLYIPQIVSILDMNFKSLIEFFCFSFFEVWGPDYLKWSSKLSNLEKKILNR